MARQPSYLVVYEGRVMPMYEYAKLKGFSRDTLSARANRGQPIIQPGDDEKLSKRVKTRQEEKTGYYHGYTYEELKSLYKNFAGQPDELRMLMDFSGLGRMQAKQLLEKIKYDRRKGI